ncbi:TetR/AcrR family transcriptional regulator [Spongiactinospora sp. TRM90649]|uniref:TetR/AcrR family transcriptional regulator n=1 Tax=Spongiactinospora sp. TRM90649 TaxID=3031114 RepID=UPI0023F9DB3D|nr:TetR/AcrR family transcriptional regulator [Spongiactinospora sp. TRM90649]MDF5754273.1 TetR/AcrR family transcriptional regulator [Spongiactinospora sp. TRM90649]
MARPREFDEQNVVAKATHLFWCRGYNATSVRDLGAELDLKQSSLYRTFNDKRTLFLRTLDHYRATESAQAEERLSASGPSLQILREWLIWMIGHEAGRGCFVVNTATELGAADPDVRERTEAAFEGTRTTLAALLRRGVHDGELPAALDVDAAAESLFTTVLGLRVRERAGHDPGRLATAIDFAIESLAGPRALQ